MQFFMICAFFVTLLQIICKNKFCSAKTFKEYSNLIKKSLDEYIDAPAKNEYFFFF